METMRCLKYVVLMFANIEGEMVSAERILYYLNNTEQEASDIDNSKTNECENWRLAGRGKCSGSLRCRQVVSKWPLGGGLTELKL